MITIDVDDSGILNGLQRLSGRLDDMTPVMAEIGEALREASMEAFDAETAPEEGGWSPLAPSTLRRRRGGPVHRILQDTGALRQSITRQTEGQRAVRVGSRVDYAAYHMTGTRRMPARPYLGVSDDARGEIMDAIRVWLEDTA